MKFITTAVILQLFAIFCAKAQESDFTSMMISSQDKSHNLTVIEQWQAFEKRIKLAANSAVKRLLPRLMENSGNLNLSSQCMRNAMLLISGIKNLKPWALRIIDSSAKFPDGILVGSLSAFGVYDECLDTVATSDRSRDKGKVLFRGQYCTVNMKPPLLPQTNHYYKLNEVLPEFKNFSEGGTAISEAAKYAQYFYFLSLRLGLCVPSGCSVEDVSKIVNHVGNFLYLHANVSRCEVKEDNVYLPVHILVMTVYSFAGFLMLIGTSIDIYSYYAKVTFRHTAIRALLAFSLLTNFKKFSNTKTSSDTLRCLNGIRFLCMTWIILGHTYLNVNHQMFLGLEKVVVYAKDFAFQAVTNASVAVDTFFCMGGLILCYLMVKLVKLEGQPFSLTIYIIHRLWRIIPVYIFVILFMFISNLLGSGPLWYDTTHKFVQNCFDNWWTNLLFINNFYNAENMCIPQSWYLASDFQLYLAALVIMLPLVRWPKVGISISILGIIGSVVYAGVGTYVNDFPPAMLFIHPDPAQRLDFWARFYFKPFIHAGPYCIGILTGYILAMKPNLKFSRTILVLGWSLAFIFNFSVLYGVVEWNRGTEPTFWGRILYASFNRTAWALGVAWMILCCCTGQGGIINYVLSWKVFIPLGRLTFIAYLIHPIVQVAVVGNVRTRIQPDHFFATWIYFGHIFATYSTAFVGSMLVESPLMALEKIIFARTARKAEESAVVRNGNILKGTLTTEKNGDIAVIVPNGTEVPFGVDNNAVVYRL